ncbi:hypothetical protein PHYBOEH_004179 [Phytophthora boehmeriae]|uniref:RxLR effector protein n=1 Tax=Phytophthora boehmeriae TaxID=109152 RepID=A0A8T1WRH8_9STRA|nr:hypothetical protein PHYBOEH_004179 [Phytophthora boehmeriae]
MRLHHVLLATLASLLVTSSTCSAVIDSNEINLLTPASFNGRRLRGSTSAVLEGATLQDGKTVGNGVDADASWTVEERRIPGLSSLTKMASKTSKKATSAVKSVEANYWVKTGKSDDYVKKALGLDKLSVDKLRTHPNYKYFAQFQTGRLKVWLKKDLSTGDVWRNYGLNKMPFAQAEKTIEFQFYTTYVKMFDFKRSWDVLVHRIRNG